MSTDLKTLCQRMADELDYCHIRKEGNDRSHPLACEARAALAELVADGPAVPEGREPASVVGEPSDDELLELSQFHCVSYTLSNGSVVSPFVEGTDIRSEVLSFARAAISRYGHQPAPPADVAPGPSMEDVGPLIAWLTEQAHYAADASQPARTTDARMLTWAAQVIGERVDEDAPAPLAEPEVEGPTDEEVEAWAKQEGFVGGHADLPFGFWIDYADVGALVRAALSRWGHQPAPPDEGVDRSHISDGYHTFAELYGHRHSLMLALMRAIPKLCWFSQRHADGEMPFGTAEWFIAGVDLPTGAITYHLPSELLSLAQQTGAAELSVGRPWDGHTANDVIERLRAWVASPQPALSAEGEVGELVAWLRDRAESTSLAHNALRITRAADLLEQRHPTPVPVSERLPGPGDCDADDYCWRWNTIGGLWARQPLARSWYEFESHWLPSTALPLPQGEGEK